MSTVLSDAAFHLFFPVVTSTSCQGERATSPRTTVNPSPSLPSPAMPFPLLLIAASLPSPSHPPIVLTIPLHCFCVSDIYNEMERPHHSLAPSPPHTSPPTTPPTTTTPTPPPKAVHVDEERKSRWRTAEQMRIEASQWRQWMREEAITRSAPPSH